MRARKTPCSDCLFRRQSLPGWIGSFESPEELLVSAVSEAPYSCHSVDETTDMEDPDKLQCAGRLMFAVKAAKSFRNIAIETLRLEAKKSSEGAQILGLGEFLDHHRGIS